MKKLIFCIFILILNSVVSAQQPPLPVLNTGESYTQLYSVSFDYQSMGSIRYIVQDPTNPQNLCAILMAQQDSNSSLGTQRYIYYSYSEDGGTTWTSDVMNQSSSWGFPCISLNSYNVPIFSAHKSGGTNGVFKDVVWAGFSLSEIYGMPTNINASGMQVTGTTNGNITIVASSSDEASRGGFYTTYNGNSWTQWKPLFGRRGSTGNFIIESGSNGVVGIFEIVNETGTIFYFKSTDNGLTFDNGTRVFDKLIDGADTLYTGIVGGFQAVYTNDNVPHLAFTIYKAYDLDPVIPNTARYIKPKIMHWSPVTGLTQIAGESWSLDLCDTITTSLMAPLCQPSLGVTEIGRLICSFTTFVKGNTQIVDNGQTVNAGEIFASGSSNGGASWISPKNITNTPGIEEKNSSLPRHIVPPGGIFNDYRIFYVRDMKAGNWVNVPGFGKAPVYGIHKYGGIFGISVNKINSEAASSKLSPNYPNPFNPSTKINFSLTNSEFTSLIVYDALGKEITRLVNERLDPGSYEYEFNADNFGLSSGIYFYRIQSGNFVETKQMCLVK